MMTKIKNIKSKKIFSRSFAALLISLYLIPLTGCSALPKRSIDKNSAVELTVLSVSDQYLRAVSSGNASLVDRLVLWSSYMQGFQKSKSRPVVLNKISSLKNTWDPKDNLLSKLDLQKIGVKENEASVEFLSETNKDTPKIKVNLVWSGNRWLIANDNLFGENGVIQ